ncbi:MAG: PDZ domain-containing protein [Saprospiraceae bacterium]|nr:PDZ domain-containing protein [Saprospiraceae bacterium]MBK7219919.1 PDZ domain-containing protein [Saprospiraceae bacterium]MBK7787144.1 PDZ domain-containing protein [Saprospiraceae bacterium]MBK8849558.1 PDZ domain-containing protein [Saprospiraceae bacterium]MBK9687240.1 PDZ domain-containing protein [Saprospiraceae bacterium]
MKKLFLAAILFAGLVSNSQAQEDKKVVIKKVEKSEMSDGEKKGSGKEKRVVVQVETNKDAATEGEAELSITKEINNGVEKSMYTLTENNDGEVKVIKWDGEGEMPAEIREKLADVDVAIEGDDEKMIWIEKHVESGAPKMKMKKFKWDDEQPATPKVKLGVMISDKNNGVLVDEVFKGSSADKAGLEKGDIILKLNEKYIFSDKALFETLAGFKEGDKIGITVLRNNKEKSMSLTF